MDLRRWPRRCGKVVREDPEQLFLYNLVKIYKLPPTDSFYEEMEPALKLWHYECWVREEELKIEMLKSHGILVGSFSNPEAANKMIMQDKPTFNSSDEDFENTAKMVREMILEEEAEKKKKKRGRGRRKIVKK